MSFIGGSGAVILETQSATGSWSNGLTTTSDPTLGIVVGIASSLVPTADNAYDIGTYLKRLRVLHVTKINDNAAGETLEIGNYTADTGVTGVYGQLQGKGGSWKLYTSGGNGVLNGVVALNLSAASGISITPGSSLLTVTGDSGVRISGTNGYANLIPPASAGGNFGISASTALNISSAAATQLYLSGGSIWVNPTGAVTVQGGTDTILKSGASNYVYSINTLGFRIADAAGSNPTTYVSGSGGSSITTTNLDLTVACNNMNLNAASTYSIYTKCAGFNIRNTAGTHTLQFVPGNSGTNVYTSGTGNTAIKLYTDIVSLGVDSLTPTSNISVGGASTTATTTNIGCSTAGVTNTINIGQIAANDVTNLTGVMMRSPEFVQVALTSSVVIGATGQQSIPSMSSITAAGRYLTWNDTNHRFQNSHSTKTLTVMITATVSWSAGPGARKFYVNNHTDSTIYGWMQWAAADLTTHTITCVVRIGPYDYATPYFDIGNVVDGVYGDASAATPRLTFTATVI